ncbi:sigma-70 family RNA polymerase sigma factor [Zongyangia hominis]|uniref:RNA polymerase sigma factor SigS n=1 Tax=Zongyangia hominis TaxID=2763677 RepID=A0A926ED31_9FIRM|nr:sigma-70 family RNA polymerase sigma factor [Zongyangia hominis]MBC8570184.1 sigma-70 family RNA polymerase sigma factor [Zongyangia hominis]
MRRIMRLTMMGKSASPLDETHCDEWLIREIRNQNPNAMGVLFDRYIPVAKMKARGSRIAGMEEDDIFQEAMIGLIGAVRSYREDRESSFKTFANLCMNRRIASVAQSQQSLKQKPFQNYISIDKGDDAVETQWSLMNPQQLDPEHIVIEREAIEEKKKQFENLLSVFEREALMLYIGGFTYEEISQRLESTPKAVDNALQRVRRKLRSAS